MLLLAHLDVATVGGHLNHRLWILANYALDVIWLVLSRRLHSEAGRHPAVLRSGVEAELAVGGEGKRDVAIAAVHGRFAVAEAAVNLNVAALGRYGHDGSGNLRIDLAIVRGQLHCAFGSLELDVAARRFQFRPGWCLLDDQLAVAGFGLYCAGRSLELSVAAF